MFIGSCVNMNIYSLHPKNGLPPLSGIRRRQDVFTYGDPQRRNGFPNPNPCFYPLNQQFALILISGSCAFDQQFTFTSTILCWMSNRHEGSRRNPKLILTLTKLVSLSLWGVCVDYVPSVGLTLKMTKP